MSITENYHFKVGTLKCIAINDGTEIVPAESVVKDVPAEQWSQALLEGGYSPTESVVYFNCLTLQIGIWSSFTLPGGGTCYSSGRRLALAAAD